jgi:hypothetical protein
LPPAAPRTQPPFQPNLFDWAKVYDRQFDAILDTELYDYDVAVKRLHQLPDRVWNILESRYRAYHWRRLRKRVYARDRGQCMVCGFMLTGDNEQYWECGHIIDRYLGGPDHINNLVVMCIACNRLKPGTETREDYLGWAKTMRPLL